MLELIFQGFMEWAYGLTLECWQYFSSSLLDIMSMDFAYLKTHVPVIDDIMQVLMAVGWALLIGNLVFQALKSMASGLGFEGEDPKLLFTRTFVFSFLLLASPQICDIGLSMTSKIIDLLQIPDAVNVQLVDESVFGSLTAAWLLVIIFGIIIIKVEREGGFAIGSRRLANRSQRYFFAHREDLHRIGARVKCRMLAVGPRRCLVDCYGHDLDITQREMRYASIPDLRNEYHPGMEIDCIVKVFDPDNDKLEISIKETEVNPFFGAEQRHPVGSRRLAVISGKYGGGVFCNLPDGVVCMCNYSYQHEDADFMVGENVMLIVQRYEDEKLQMYGKIMSKW